MAKKNTSVISKIRKALEGKKTYLAALAVALVAFAQVVGWVDNETASVLYGLFGAGGLVSLRMAVGRG